MIHQPPGDEALPTSAGAFTIEGLLAWGGSAHLFRGWDDQAGRPVALKRLRLDVHPSMRRRFEREAAAASKLDHPHIVRIYDVFEDAGHDWIAMELVDGPTVEQRLRRGIMPADEVFRLGCEVASGLVAAHEQGLLHRDLKSENVVLGPEGAKILDFGLVKQLDPEAGDSSLSADLAFLGTPRIMSPEQVNGLALTPRSDLFALGVLLYEASTGVSPFKATNDVVTLGNILGKQPKRASDVEPAVPIGLSKLIHRLLKKDAQQRPAGAGEVVRELQDLSKEVPGSKKAGWWRKLRTLLEK